LGAQALAPESHALLNVGRGPGSGWGAWLEFDVCFRTSLEDYTFASSLGGAFDAAHFG